jgi:SAM-dependent methyltransferase
LKTLDLGCGARKEPGAFGVDRYPHPGVDLMHDLDVVPWPLAENDFDRVVIRHVIEHVADVVAFLREAHRVAKPGAPVEIVTPHFSNRSAYADPTHRRALSARVFDFFTGGEPRPLHRAAVARHWLFEHRFVLERLPDAPRFSLLRRRVTFSRVFRRLGLEWFARRHLDFYEFYLAWIFPARDIEVTLRAEKD